MDTPCEIFPGAKDRNGYGRIGKEMAHRVVYRRAKGEIPADMTIDHVCFTKACVNVEHLQVLSRVDNSKRQRSAMKQFCSKGHEYTPENTYIKNANSPGVRDCRACGRARVKAYKARKATS